MSFFKISESIQDVANKVIDLVNAHLDYYKIVAFDKLVTILSRTISAAVLTLTGFMFIFFGSFALASFLGDILTKPYWGYLIVAGLYAIGGFVIWKNRVPWILDPMIKMLSEIVEETVNDIGLDDSAPERDDEYLSNNE